MANDEKGDIVDPNEKINDDGSTVVLKEGDEGYVAPKGDEPKETPLERYNRLQGMTKRAAKDAGIDLEEKKSTKKSEELDYGQKAFLVASGIKEADEIALVKQISSETGKSIDDVLASKYFQAELKEMRDAKLTSNAVPTGYKRSGQSAQDSVEYWIAKGELPPASERELRQKVVNARIKKETNSSVFTTNPIVR